MITTEKRYEKSIKKLKKLEDNLSILKEKKDVVKISKQIGTLQKEIKDFEENKKGSIPQELYNFENVGKLLIALRIKKGLTQHNLADLLGVTQPQVARDETSLYSGAALRKIIHTLEVMDEKLVLNRY